MESPLADQPPLTPVTFQILLCLVQGPAHGYGMKREVERRTRGAVRLGAGTLYAGLQRMERDGLIEETGPPVDQEGEHSPRWRYYGPTRRGRAVLEAEIRRLEADVAAARKLVPGSEGA